MNPGRAGCVGVLGVDRGMFGPSPVANGGSAAWHLPVSCRRGRRSYNFSWPQRFRSDFVGQTNSRRGLPGGFDRSLGGRYIQRFPTKRVEVRLGGWPAVAFAGRGGESFPRPRGSNRCPCMQPERPLPPWYVLWQLDSVRMASLTVQRRHCAAAGNRGRRAGAVIGS